MGWSKRPLEKEHECRDTKEEKDWVTHALKKDSRGRSKDRSLVEDLGQGKGAGGP
jgi:hypothetical protein